MKMRGAVAAVVLVTLAALLASCSDDSVADDEARLTVSGLVTLTPPGGGARVIDRGRTVDFGDVIRIDEGTATLELANGDLYELRASETGAESSRIEVGAPPRLLDGDALLGDGFPLALATGDAVVTARGPTRVRSEVPSVASYAGDAQIDGVTGVNQVAGLRSVHLGADAVATPIVYDPDDAWDRRYLGEAHAFGERLEALSRGYTAELQRNTGLSAAFYRRVFPALDRESDFSDGLIDPARPAGEHLVGAAVAVSGTDGTFRERWVAIFRFRDQGASWGLVALEQGVSSTPLVETIELAVGASPLSDDPRTTAPSPTTTDDADDPDESPDTSVPDSSPTTTVPPDEPTTTTIPPEPDGLIGTVLSPVTTILDEVLEALGLGDPP